MAASYPTSTKSFTTKIDGQTVSAAHMNDAQDEIVAVETGLRDGLAHDLKFTDASYDIGKSGATRPRHGYFSGNLTAGGYLGPVLVPLNRQVTPASNGTTVETTLMTYTLPAAKLAATGDSVRIRSNGTAAANGNTKTLRLYFGATVIATYAATPNNIPWLVEGEVSRTAAATQTAFGSVEHNTSGKVMTSSSPAETLSGTVIIKITGQSGTASTDLTANNFAVDFVPAP